MELKNSGILLLPPRRGGFTADLDSPLYHLQMIEAPLQKEKGAEEVTLELISTG